MSARIPFAVVAKPTGAACNLDCSYCFFLSKEVLWGAAGQQMSDEMLRTYLARHLDASPDGEVVLTWQGGEPTLRGVDFFRRAVELGRELARPGQVVRHSLQTNGTLLDDEWGEFLSSEQVLVGLSIDGPASMHDHYRVNKAGRGTHAQVMRGWQVLERYGVDTNVLCTVNAANQDHPLEVYRWFRDEMGARYLQFIPVVERVEAGKEALAEARWRRDGEYVLYQQSGEGVTSRSVDPVAWGRFMRTVFDEWVAHDVGQVFVQHFDVMLSACFGQYSLCVHAPECGRALTVEHNGDVYSCDHYVQPDHRLGNIVDLGFPEMLTSDQQREFGRRKRTALTQQCRRCPVRWVCHGGCPKDRFALSADGEPGQNYLCKGYYDFFTHAASAIERMAQMVASGRAAAEVMERP